MLQAELPYNQRVELGKADEQRQVAVLRSKGYVIEEVSADVDMKEKIDRYLVRKDGSRDTIQIKGRDTDPTRTAVYKDILVDEFEPYCGLDHELTVYGRDHVSPYDWFTCRIQNTLYLISGKAQKQVTAKAVEEWRSSEERTTVDEYLAKWLDTLSFVNNNPVWVKTDLFRRFPVLYCNNRVQVRCTQDRKNHRPKLLIFIPPTIYTPKQAQTFHLN